MNSECTKLASSLKVEFMKPAVGSTTADRGPRARAGPGARGRGTALLLDGLRKRDALQYRTKRNYLERLGRSMAWWVHLHNLDRLFGSWIIVVLILSVAISSQGNIILVLPGDSIQAAIDLAQPEDTIKVQDGLESLH